ncbi:hypothetical protein AYI68_g6620 [Smittium mucronatum]|uniref:PhoD-like phosphatase domain-containing protein n=1 Tax=Smittium mucronatum TaxID=133383 RepID=A0A1R0GR28_9FUNG|nr:hypothetical protein AYI68_g6620 [Smittium mucronatum]
MDFPVIKNYQGQGQNDGLYSNDSPHSGYSSMENSVGIYVNNTPPIEELPKDRQYDKYFNPNGDPIHPLRSDGILGPILQFVDTDLNTAEWVGSLLLLVPRYYPIPTVTFIDPLFRDQPLYGQPTEIGGYRESVFIRYDIRISLHYDQEKTIFYQINGTPTHYNFTIPSQTTQWRWNFWTCNGWSMNVSDKAKKELGGNDVVWDDMLKKHKEVPFHVQIGGGDQLYCDLFWENPIWKPFYNSKSKTAKNSFPFSDDMTKFIDEFFFVHYVINFFYTSKFTEAISTIPVSFIIDDHDIFDGWGSYPDYLHNSNVFQGIKKFAFKYFLLFQLQTNHEMSRSHGYFGFEGYNWLKSLGPFVTIYGADTRFERCLEQIISEKTLDMVFDRLSRLPSTVKHLFVVTGVPVIYPRLTMVENTLSFMSKHSITKISIFQKDGALATIANQFGEPELLDDLNDHWTAEIHIEERKKLVLRLQEVSRRQHIRVTFVAGDVHCAGAGRFVTDVGSILPENDYRFMPQVISSAIMNIPPPNAVIRMAHYSAKKYVLDGYTSEKMYTMFESDVNGKSPPNNNKKLLGRRNFSSFVEDLDSGSVIVHIHCQSDTNIGTVAYPLTIAPLNTSNNYI